MLSRRDLGETVTATPSNLQQSLKALQHDVKNPIGNVLGYIDLLREGSTMSEEQLALLKRIELNCQLVLQALNRFSDTVVRETQPE